MGEWLAKTLGRGNCRGKAVILSDFSSVLLLLLLCNMVTGQFEDKQDKRLPAPRIFCFGEKEN